MVNVFSLDRWMYVTKYFCGFFLSWTTACTLMKLSSKELKANLCISSTVSFWLIAARNAAPDFAKKILLGWVTSFFFLKNIVKNWNTISIICGCQNKKSGLEVGCLFATITYTVFTFDIIFWLNTSHLLGSL